MIILGRGTSLKKLSVYDSIEDQNISIINNFNYELDLDYIKDFLKGRSVTQFINRETASFLKKEHYINFNIKCVLNVLHKEYSKSPIKSIFEQNNIVTQCLPDSILDFSKDGKGGFPTTGILSIIYSTVVLNEKNIYIVGIDFYDTNYNSGRISKDYQNQKGLIMKDFLFKHIQKTPDVNYKICTDSNWRVDLPNLEFV
jgi:hypothetical protein